MNARQQVIWLLSMPACAEVNHAMLELTGVSYSTSEQNKCMPNSRQAGDMKDTQTLLFASAERSPFTPHAHLINIITGVYAENSAKCGEGQRSWTHHLGLHDSKISCRILIHSKEVIRL